MRGAGQAWLKAYGMQDIPPDFDLVFVERAPHERGFAEHFERHIKPKLLEIERARLDALAAIRKRLLIAVLIGAVFVLTVIVMWANVVAGNEWIAMVLYISAVAGGWLWYWVRGPTRQYAVDRKHVIIPEVLKFIGDFHYEPRGKIDEETLRASRLFKPWKRYDSEQLVSGSHLGRPFQFAEVELSKGDSGFKGFILTLEMSSWTSHMTIAVRGRGIVPDLFGGVLKSFKGLQKVWFDHAEFEHEFEVYSTSEEESRKLISPELIAGLRMLGALRGSNTIEFGVHGNIFLLKIDTTRDHFEPVQVVDSALSTEASSQFLEQLHEVLDVIEIVATATDSHWQRLPAEN